MRDSNPVNASGFSADGENEDADQDDPESIRSSDSEFY